MKPFFVFLILFAVAFEPVVKGQDNSDKNKRNYPVGDFEKIVLEGNYRVYLSHSEKSFLKVEAPSDDMYDAIEVNSDNGSLQLSVKKTRFYLNRIDLYIGSPNIRDLEVSGDIKVTTDGYLDADDLNMLVQGGANVDMSLKAKRIDVRCEGAVLLEMRGVTDNLFVKISGAGHVNARELTAKDVTIRVEGVGFGSVYATNLLDVKIEGVGKVTYKGNPDIKRIISGLGKVEQY
jgi:hypothetical protein